MAIYQAESATFVGPLLFSGRDAAGDGYVDYQNPTGDYIEWNIDVLTAGTYNLAWRYANGSTNRPLALTVNGVEINSALDFDSTANWLTWEFVNQAVDLQAGANTIRLTAIGSSGANFDYLEVLEIAPPPPTFPTVAIANAQATEGSDNFLVFGVALSEASTEAITLDLAATDGTAQGGAQADFLVDPSGNPVDYDNQSFEVSSDGGATWQAATNGTEVTFAAGQTNLQVRLAVNDDDAVEDTETLTLGVSSVLAGTVDTFSDTGTGSIVDNDEAPTPPPPSPGFDVTLQAEDAVYNGPLLFTGRGADGDAYIDYQNLTGDFIEWTVNVATAGSYNLAWRYANGSTNRPLTLSINGNTIDPSLDFDSTGDWLVWDFVNLTANLQEGDNVIRLTANGSSGANFDYLRITSDAAPPPPSNPTVSIANAQATEGSDGLVFGVTLSNASTEAITLDLVATDGTAKGGAGADFLVDPEGDPVDYDNQSFEVSADGGATWQAATNGTEVTFAPGQTSLQVRLAVNDDNTAEGAIAETLTLGVAAVLAGTVANATDTGQGSILDNDNNSDPNEPGVGAPLSLLPYTDIRLEGDFTFDFDGTDGGMIDGDGDALGFTMIDPTSNPSNANPPGGVVGYRPDLLDVNPATGLLQITTTPGIQFLNNNNLDNALGIGLNLPSEALRLETTLVDLPTPVGGFSQAGLWLGQAVGGGSGSSEDNYIKLVVMSNEAGNYVLQALMEQNGTVVAQSVVDVIEDPASLSLSLVANPATNTVTAQYSVAGGTTATITSFSNVPQEWFSFDQAGIDPTLATRSFGGIFATHRNAGSSQVYSFDSFSVTEEEVTTPPPPSPGFGNLPFDRWTLPVNNPTAMDMGPDGRLYVATLFGTIYAFSIDSNNRTFQREEITTIRDDEGGNRLTLGIAVDPDSTADNVILWVGHSDGSVNQGQLNSGKISRLSGPGFTQKVDVVTGLPRAIANHALNNIDFGPDGKLYIWQGGNTGAGSANTAPTEFGDRPEQPLSAALLVADIPSWKADPASFHSDASSPLGEFIDEFYARKAQELGRPYTEVQVFASGLRNTYDGVFHSNGNIYAPDNGLGVIGTVPPVPRLGDPTDRTITTQFGNTSLDNPGPQADPLNLIVEGGYYGHPNPYRDEVIFKDGTFQGFNASNRPPGHPEFIEPLFNLGNNRSANGIIEYADDNFFGALRGDLLITNYSSGDDITRIELNGDGQAVTNSSSLIGGFRDPLPIAMGPNGTLFVGEFNGGSVTVLEPLGIWRDDLPTAPLQILDAGGASLDGRLYMLGGKTATTHLDSMYIYDPGDPFDASDDTWTVGQNLPGPGVENPAVVSLDGLLYAFGGSTAPFSGAVTNAAVYNPATQSWTALPDMPTARGGATAQVLDGKIYVLGGMGTDGASLNTVEVFDPLTGSWETGNTLQVARDNLGAAVVDDRLYVFGGRTRNADGSVVDGTLESLEIYDPFTDQWTFGASMLTGRRAMSVGTVNGRIQVVGGENAPDGSAFGVHEEYNPVTNSWRSLPGINTPRHGAAAATIGNIFYVAGGGPSSGSSFTDAVEAFSF